jgi:hypothetical protein
VKTRKGTGVSLTKAQRTRFTPRGSIPGREMLVVNWLVVPGAFRVMCAWFAGAWEEKNTRSSWSSARCPRREWVSTDRLPAEEWKRGGHERPVPASFVLIHI